MLQTQTALHFHSMLAGASREVLAGLVSWLVDQGHVTEGEVFYMGLVYLEGVGGVVWGRGRGNGAAGPLAWARNWVAPLHPRRGA
jgi:hypothetical protein